MIDIFSVAVDKSEDDDVDTNAGPCSLEYNDKNKAKEFNLDAAGVCFYWNILMKVSHDFNEK